MMASNQSGGASSAWFVHFRIELREKQDAVCRKASLTSFNLGYSMFATITLYEQTSLNSILDSVVPEHAWHHLAPTSSRSL